MQQKDESSSAAEIHRNVMVLQCKENGSKNGGSGMLVEESWMNRVSILGTKHNKMSGFKGKKCNKGVRRSGTVGATSCSNDLGN